MSVPRRLVRGLNEVQPWQWSLGAFQTIVGVASRETRRMEENSDTETDIHHSGTHGILFKILVSVGAFVFLFCFILPCIQHQRRTMYQTRQKETLHNIFKYLHRLDADDLDIRRSSAGGFHVAYLNGLAQGHNKAEDRASSVLGKNGDGDTDEQTELTSALSSTV